MAGGMVGWGSPPSSPPSLPLPASGGGSRWALGQTAWRPLGSARGQAAAALRLRRRIPWRRNPRLEVQVMGLGLRARLPRGAVEADFRTQPLPPVFFLHRVRLLRCCSCIVGFGLCEVFFSLVTMDPPSVGQWNKIQNYTYSTIIYMTSCSH
jgi:hypothetical protein